MFRRKCPTVPFSFLPLSVCVSVCLFFCALAGVCVISMCLCVHAKTCVCVQYVVSLLNACLLKAQRPGIRTPEGMRLLEGRISCRAFYDCSFHLFSSIILPSSHFCSPLGSLNLPSQSFLFLFIFYLLLSPTCFSFILPIHVFSFS